MKINKDTVLKVTRSASSNHDVFGRVCVSWGPYPSVVEEENDDKIVIVVTDTDTHAGTKTKLILEKQ